MFKFLDILGRYEAAEFGHLEAAELLGVGERTCRRWRDRFEDDGEDGVADRLGKPSAKRVPGKREVEVKTLYRRYGDFTAKHFHEHLVTNQGFRQACWRRRPGAVRIDASGRGGLCPA